MRSKELIGRKIIDAAGNTVGQVEDIDIDWDSKKFVAIIAGGVGEIAQKLFGALGARGRSDLPIPVEDIAVLGEVIILSKKV